MTASPASLAPVVAQLAEIAIAAKLGSATVAGDGSPASGFADALRAASLKHEVADARTAAQATADVVTDAAATAGLVMPWIIPLVPVIAAGASAVATAADAIADAVTGTATDATAGTAGGSGRLADPGLSAAPESAVASARKASPRVVGAALAALEAAATSEVVGAAGVAVELPTPPAVTTTPAPISTDALVANIQAAAAALPAAKTAAAGADAPTNVATERAAASTIDTELAGTDAPEVVPGATEARASAASPRASASLAASAVPAEARSSAAPVAAAVTGSVAAHEREGAKLEAAIAASPSAATVPLAPAARELATLVQAVDTQVAAPGWHEAVAQRLAEFVSVRAGDAEIRLNPANLGPVGVEISYKGNEASVLITAAQPATRDALEQALPHLRELLAQQGIALGQANVRDPGNGNAWASAAAAAHQGRSAAAEPETVPTLPMASARSNRLVDTFA